MDSRNSSSSHVDHGCTLVGVMRKQRISICCNHNFSKTRASVKNLSVWGVILGIVMVAGMLMDLLFWHFFSFSNLPGAFLRSGNHTSIITDFATFASLENFFEPPAVVVQSLNVTVPVVGGTSIKGLSEVQRFRSHVACFSEGGRWEYNDTVRAFPRNNVGDEYSDYCEFRLRYLIKAIASQPEVDLIASQSGGKEWKVREELKWEWQTNSSCPMLPFNRDDFCKRIGSKGNVLIVGDSINHQIYWTLLNGLNKTLEEQDSPFEGRHITEVCSDVLGGGEDSPGAFKLGFIRNDRLSLVLQEPSKDNNLYFREWPWVPYLNEWQIQILFLNRGAHYEPDNLYTEALTNAFSLLQAQYPHLLVIYRDTPPGHVNCTNFSSPILERQNDTNIPYHWADFYAQNLLAKAIVESAGYIYMNVDSMLSLRPDGHIHEADCLHYCLPGPLDVVVKLFYNILRVAKI